jgi:hypothetical protein
MIGQNVVERPLPRRVRRTWSGEPSRRNTGSPRGTGRRTGVNGKMVDPIYKSSSHARYLCQYHIVFCPKFRYNVLSAGVENELRAVITDVSATYGYEILEMESCPTMFACSPVASLPRRRWT